MISSIYIWLRTWCLIFYIRFVVTSQGVTDVWTSNIYNIAIVIILQHKRSPMAHSSIPSIPSYPPALLRAFVASRPCMSLRHSLLYPLFTWHNDCTLPALPVSFSQSCELDRKGRRVRKCKRYVFTECTDIFLMRIA